MDTQSSDQDRQESPDDASPTPPTPPIDDGRFSVPWALPDEDDADER
jgi:hypothetical protein